MNNFLIGNLIGRKQIKKIYFGDTVTNKGFIFELNEKNEYTNISSGQEIDSIAFRNYFMLDNINIHISSIIFYQTDTESIGYDSKGILITVNHNVYRPLISYNGYDLIVDYYRHMDNITILDENKISTETKYQFEKLVRHNVIFDRM